MDVNAPVKTAGRTLDVFELFETVGRPLSLSELSRGLGIPVSSCHGLVRTLRQRGYLYTVGGRDLYPTRRILDLARRIVARDPLLERVGPALRRLRDDTRETVLLGKRQDGGVLYLDVAEGPQTVRYIAAAAETKPLHSSSIGKALLAQAGDADLARELALLPMPRVTEATITDPSALLEDLRQGRARGWFMTQGENVADVLAVAVATEVGGEAYGIAVAGPLERMRSRLDEHVAHLLATKELVERGDEGA